MSHEARINDALKQLGEEFRLGMVQAEEYRARRRALLESWGERDATTSPGSLRSRTSTAPNPEGSGGAAAAPVADEGSKAPLLIVAGVVAVLAVGGYFALRGGGPETPAVVPLSPQLVAVRRAADEFLANNAWDAQGVERFLEVWRALDAADVARSEELPSLVTLRHKLEQNIQAEAQLVGPDSPPEARARLALLEEFARELAGQEAMDAAPGGSPPSPESSPEPAP